MNQYQMLFSEYTLNAFRKKPPDEQLRQSFAGAILTCKCPHCGCDPTFYCETPGGRKVWPPHEARRLWFQHVYMKRKHTDDNDGGAYRRYKASLQKRKRP